MLTKPKFLEFSNTQQKVHHTKNLIAVVLKQKEILFVITKPQDIMSVIKKS